MNARPRGRASGYAGKLSGGGTTRNRTAAIGRLRSRRPSGNILISIFIDRQ